MGHFLNNKLLTVTNYKEIFKKVNYFFRILL